MVCEQVADGVHVVTTHGVVTWTLVADDAGLLAVDAGLTRSWEELALLCARLGRDPRELRAVLLTHAHVDHTGFARRAQEVLAAPVHLHPADVRLLKHPLLGSRTERLPLAYLGSASARHAAAALARGGALRTPVPRKTVALRPGPLAGLPGAPVLYATPGHTAGHCSVHLPAAGVVVAGDAIVTHDPYTGRTGPRLIARGATWSAVQARASLAVLAGLDAEVLVCGHGPVWTGGVAAAAERAASEPQG